MDSQSADDLDELSCASDRTDTSMGFQHRLSVQPGVRITATAEAGKVSMRRADSRADTGTARRVHVAALSGTTWPMGV